MHKRGITPHSGRILAVVVNCTAALFPFRVLCGFLLGANLWTGRTRPEPRERLPARQVRALSPAPSQPRSPRPTLRPGDEHQVSTLGSWVGVRRLFHLYLFLTASRMVLPQDPRSTNASRRRSRGITIACQCPLTRTKKTAFGPRSFSMGAALPYMFHANVTTAAPIIPVS